jgi:hypothetical protein
LLCWPELPDATGAALLAEPAEADDELPVLEAPAAVLPEVVDVWPLDVAPDVLPELLELAPLPEVLVLAGVDAVSSALAACCTNSPRLTALAVRTPPTATLIRVLNAVRGVCRLVMTTTLRAADLSTLRIGCTHAVDDDSLSGSQWTARTLRKLSTHDA